MYGRKLPLMMVAFASLAAAAFAGPATRYVSTHGADTGDCTLAPCHTIGYAVGQASPGDTIRVGAGTYAESVTIDKQLTLDGAGPAFRHDDHEHHDHGQRTAIIDATGEVNGVVITGAAAAGTILRGLTIENAGREGVFADQTTDLTITDNVLQGNDAFGPFSPECPASDPDDCGEALHLQTVTNSVVSDNLVRNNVGGILLTDEEGPTSGNLITRNRVLDNTKDCGITLASHYLIPTGPAVTPDAGGVYHNQVLYNTSIGNGAAGIGVFAGPPGAAAWGNVVIGNVANDNGLPGVAIHSHTPFQTADDNVVAYNSLSGNGPDDDANTVLPTGISVFSAVDPIPHTTVAFNQVRKEHYGVFTVKAVAVSGLATNDFAHSVDVPVSQH
jgi:nitrous oxidase accessory protein NosD